MKVCVLLGSAFQNLDLSKIITLALVTGVEVSLDLFCKLRRMENLLYQGLVSLCSWHELDLCIYPSWMGPFHITSSGLVSDIYENLLTFHCSADGRVLKISYQFLTASVLDPLGCS